MKERYCFPSEAYSASVITLVEAPIGKNLSDTDSIWYSYFFCDSGRY